MNMNMTDENDSFNLTNTIANLESYLSDAALSKNRSSEKDTRVSIHVRSYRKLNGDPDGISAKAAIDGIVDRGILADDSTKQVKAVTFENFTGCKQEETVILITQEI